MILDLLSLVAMGLLLFILIVLAMVYWGRTSPPPSHEELFNSKDPKNLYDYEVKFTTWLKLFIRRFII